MAKQEKSMAKVAEKKGQTEIRHIKCGNRELSYILTRKTVKNVNLRIKPDGTVCISANRRVPLSFIENFIREKQDFIFAALDRYKEKQDKVPQMPKKYVSGERIRLLGRDYQLEVMEAAREEIFIQGDILYFKVKDIYNLRHKELFMAKWLRESQEKLFCKICDEVYPLFQPYGVAYPQIKIRRMTSRWGSCQPSRGIITLNSRLIEAPRSSIEYVVLHEFAHFIHPNHSRDFWNLVAAFMPDYKQRKKELENIV